MMGDEGLGCCQEGLLIMTDSVGTGEVSFSSRLRLNLGKSGGTGDETNEGGNGKSGEEHVLLSNNGGFEVQVKRTVCLIAGESGARDGGMSI